MGLAVGSPLVNLTSSIITDVFSDRDPTNVASSSQPQTDSECPAEVDGPTTIMMILGGT